MRLLTAIGVTVLVTGMSAPLAHAQKPPRGSNSPVPYHLINQLVPPGLINSPPSAAPAQTLPGGINSRQLKFELLAENHLRLTGEVQLDATTWQIYADEIDLFPEEPRLVATGNVVFTSDGGRIEAERVEFDLDTETGTFYNATLGGVSANP